MWPILNRHKRLLPKLLLCLPGYTRKTAGADLLAGVTVGFVALPLAMAFAISSGLPPQAGLYCAIVAGFVCAALGGSRYQISGPTGAFVVVVSGIVAKHGIEGLFICTATSGVFLFFLGASGLGSAVKFIPRPVVIGFTNGIAVLIASTQLKDLFGLQIQHLPSDLVQRIREIALQFHTISWSATIISALSLAALILLRKHLSRVPPVVVVLFVGTALVWLFGIPVETVHSRFGSIPRGLPTLHVPTFRPDLMLQLLGPTITITMLGAIESLLSAVVADRMGHDKHNPNVELMAQGAANILCPFVGGIPATGAIARTATNIRAGGQTPVAGIVHALTLACILAFGAGLAEQIPLCLLAAILMTVAYNMGEWHEIAKIIKLGPADITVWATTFFLTVFADLTVAVEAGLILAALLFIRRVTDSTTVTEVTQEDIHTGRQHVLQDKNIPTGVSIFRIHGPFLFGAAEKLAVISNQIDSLPPVVILRLRNMTAIDATGLSALEDLAAQLRGAGRQMLICGMRKQPQHFFDESGFGERIGPSNVCANIDSALIRAQEILGRVAGQGQRQEQEQEQEQGTVAADRPDSRPLAR